MAVVRGVFQLEVSGALAWELPEFVLLLEAWELGLAMLDRLLAWQRFPSVAGLLLERLEFRRLTVPGRRHQSSEGLVGDDSLFEEIRESRMKQRERERRWWIEKMEVDQ